MLDKRVLPKEEDFVCQRKRAARNQGVDFVSAVAGALEKHDPDMTKTLNMVHRILSSKKKDPRQ